MTTTQPATVAPVNGYRALGNRAFWLMRQNGCRIERLQTALVMS
ncbi:MAG: hypothetical protein Q7K20_10225 [Polaromonas sp.]|jgi:hypothetical protein|nr:hypothetical protein [Polaromonas sp.]